MLLYGEESTTFDTPVQILFYQVGISKAYKLKSIVAWGDAAGDFEILVNDEVKAGCRTSDQERTKQVWWGDSFICNEGDQIEILATHYSSGLRALKCNLELVRLA